MLILFMSLAMCYSILHLSPIQTNAEQTGPYTILTNINQDDDYYPAVSALQNYRGATVVKFVSSINESLPALKELKPQYVAVAVKPQTIDIDFVAQTYDTLRHIDDDDFLDAAIGYFTAANAADMINLVANTAKAESQANPEKYASLVYSETTFGGVMQRSKVYRDFFSSNGWNTSYADTYNKTTDFYNKLSKCSLITVDMHGNPESVEGLSSSEVKAGPSQFLFPAVAIASSCYAACTYNVTSECDSCQANYTINPNNSFALSFINKGAVGYFGHLRMYGANWYVLEQVLYGLAALNITQGQAMSYALNSQLNTYVNPSTHNFTTTFDWLSDAKTMLFGYVLYGDPAYRPCEKSSARHIMTENLALTNSTSILNLKFSRNVTLLKYLNGSYNNDVEWGYLASGPWVYRLALPKSFALNNAFIINYTDPSARMNSVTCQKWIVENSSLNNFLHISIAFGFQDIGRIVNGTNINIGVLGILTEPAPTPTATSTPTQFPTPTQTQNPTPSPTAIPATINPTPSVAPTATLTTLSSPTQSPATTPQPSSTASPPMQSPTSSSPPQESPTIKPTTTINPSPSPTIPEYQTWVLATSIVAITVITLLIKRRLKRNKQKILL